ncbi:hypothetical protein C8J56DRAFT_895081 [Mycena floridula]|nr:hypothetical protein C8J56DRAFT_895081 [Mycena floridula]
MSENNQQTNKILTPAVEDNGSGGDVEMGNGHQTVARSGGGGDPVHSNSSTSENQEFNPGNIIFMGGPSAHMPRTAYYQTPSGLVPVNPTIRPPADFVPISSEEMAYRPAANDTSNIMFNARNRIAALQRDNAALALELRRHREQIEDIDDECDRLHGERDKARSEARDASQAKERLRDERNTYRRELDQLRHEIRDSNPALFRKSGARSLQKSNEYQRRHNEHRRMDHEETGNFNKSDGESDSESVPEGVPSGISASQQPMSEEAMTPPPKRIHSGNEERLDVPGGTAFDFLSSMLEEPSTITDESFPASWADDIPTQLHQPFGPSGPTFRGGMGQSFAVALNPRLLRQGNGRNSNETQLPPHSNPSHNHGPPTQPRGHHTRPNGPSSFAYRGRRTAPKSVTPKFIPDRPNDLYLTVDEINLIIRQANEGNVAARLKFQRAFSYTEELCQNGAKDRLSLADHAIRTKYTGNNRDNWMLGSQKRKREQFGLPMIENPIATPTLLAPVDDWCHYWKAKQGTIRQAIWIDFQEVEGELRINRADAQGWLMMGLLRPSAALDTGRVHLSNVRFQVLLASVWATPHFYYRRVQELGLMVARDYEPRRYTGAAINMDIDDVVRHLASTGVSFRQVDALWQTGRVFLNRMHHRNPQDSIGYGHILDDVQEIDGRVVPPIPGEGHVWYPPTSEINPPVNEPVNYRPNISTGIPIPLVNASAGVDDSPSSSPEIAVQPTIVIPNVSTQPDVNMELSSNRSVPSVTEAPTAPETVLLPSTTDGEAPALGADSDEVPRDVDMDAAEDIPLPNEDEEL